MFLVGKNYDFESACMYIISHVLAVSMKPCVAINYRDFFVGCLAFSSYWADGDPQQNPCVSLDVRSGKWQSTDCSTALPFFCKQPPNGQGKIETNLTYRLQKIFECRPRAYFSVQFVTMCAVVNQNGQFIKVMRALRIAEILVKMLIYVPGLPGFVQL